ncbi:MAG TPA: DUF2207 domain-containing protein, partial [Actinomycetota bacterium]|nr:DUF2207 domain-containing protein [Actinomycetota bacterium]
MRRPLVTSFLLLLLLAAFASLSAPSAIAQEKSFSLPHAEVDVKIGPDGAVHVTERLTYAFSGSFSGGFREIPLREGERIENVSVSERGAAYAGGASAELGSFGPPGTYGTTQVGDRFRIVWHYSAFNEARTFVVRYTLTGLAVAYDDVVDVNLRVWGDEWGEPLGLLEARMTIPDARPGEVRVWGHAGSVEGSTALNENGKGASLSASNVPAGRWVEMRLVFPRAALDTPTFARVEAGSGLERILAEERAFALQTERDLDRVRFLRRNAFWLIPLLLLVGAIPGAAIAFYVWLRHGRE